MNKRTDKKMYFNCEEWDLLIDGFHNYAIEAIDKEGLSFDITFKVYFGSYHTRDLINNLSNECGMGIYSVRDHLYEELQGIYSE